MMVRSLLALWATSVLTVEARDSFGVQKRASSRSVKNVNTINLRLRTTSDAARRRINRDACEQSLASFPHCLRGGSDGYDGWSNNDDSYAYDQSGYGDSRRNDNEDYDDYNYGRPSRSSNTRSSSSSSSLPRVLRTGDKKIGLPMLVSGVGLMVLGIVTFFNKTLLRLGNLLFMAGVPMTIGPQRTLGYFSKREKMRATLCLILGVYLVFTGHPIIGIILEMFGLLNLFGNMFPVLMIVLKQLPVIGPMLKQSSSSKKTKKRQDDYYDDYGGGGGGNGDDYRDGANSNGQQYY